jgi:hypothetical protein
MGSLVVRILSAVGAAVLFVTVFASGIAAADPYAGITYDAAAAKISGWKGTPVVGSVSGGLLERGDCIVTSSHKSNFLDASGDNARSTEVVLNLNCNNYVASPGHPGNSAMSPEGVKAKADQQFVTNVNKNPAWCEQDDAHMSRCEKVCKRTAGCEISFS